MALQRKPSAGRTLVAHHDWDRDVMLIRVVIGICNLLVLCNYDDKMGKGMIYHDTSIWGFFFVSVSWDTYGP